MNVLIAISALLFLIILHELGHFLIAKKFHVKAEEFGIGLPPRIYKRKFGETIYSFNLLPIGAFVRLTGEESPVQDPQSFSSKPIWQRILIVGGGVASSWVVAIILFSILAVIGIQSALPDTVGDADTVKNVYIQIAAVSKDSPAEKSSIRPGDIIVAMKNELGREERPKRIQEVQEFTNASRGERITLVLQRGRETIETSLVPRENPPQGEGPLGIALLRVGLVSHPWYEAPFRGAMLTWQLTLQFIRGFGVFLSNLVSERTIPAGIQIMGPVGVIDILRNSFSLGVSAFLFFVAQIAVLLGIFNILPIPALDGGKLLFLFLEGIMRKPLPVKLVQSLIFISFALLIPLMIWVSINDIQRIF